MNKRIIDNELSLIPYYPNEEAALPWYQDRDVCKQSDNIDFVYTIDRLRQMYAYLNANGTCFYICFQRKLVGDITLKDDGEICIVVSKPYQNRHIGRRCVGETLQLAREKGIRQAKAVIYPFNQQSRNMFLDLGFVQTDEETFLYTLS